MDSDLILWGREPSCRFNMKPTSNSEDHMYMEIKCFQKNGPIHRLKFTAYRTSQDVVISEMENYGKYLYI